MYSVLSWMEAKNAKIGIVFWGEGVSLICFLNDFRVTFSEAGMFEYHWWDIKGNYFLLVKRVKPQASIRVGQVNEQVKVPLPMTAEYMTT